MSFARRIRDRTRKGIRSCVWTAPLHARIFGAATRRFASSSRAALIPTAKTSSAKRSARISKGRAIRRSLQPCAHVSAKPLWRRCRRQHHWPPPLTWIHVRCCGGCSNKQSIVGTCAKRGTTSICRAGTAKPLTIGTAGPAILSNALRENAAGVHSCASGKVGYGSASAVLRPVMRNAR